ncbi:ABC transporter ATP-binding protein [Vagococcus carniphilus]|uniref:Spermidine/putrescine ABC transporter ATP-binding protein n=1 Tax=Vagococcus carniphilus TaxID=218144 RepID=A0A430B8J3_9ENTE|nr:ATP-binding cassette domain-containing protein [Vagococcus carniphilus]QNN73861.1 ATP-binding cassette domain-containing protein [Vagococcus carniphilus]RSU16609.1 spermidine/putrescine ABC transporter ATP-binding protein [Vagococcus carniphilus]
MTNTIIKTDQLSYSANDKNILKNISFQVKEGDLITISGPSGSGKSTLLKLIANMIRPTSGDIYFNDKKIDLYLSTDYRKEVSYFFQNPVLFGETVRDNLTFPYEIRNLSFDETKAISLLESVKLTSDYLNKSIDSLSGGEKQRIAFVRNLLFQPKVLLLDEVTSALDHENRQIIYNIIHSLNQNKQITILWVTHNEEEFLSSNQQLIIDNGTIKEDINE